MLTSNPCSLPDLKSATRNKTMHFDLIVKLLKYKIIRVPGLISNLKM